MRLNKYLSDAGVCSRREADRNISEGKVLVNGKVAELGTQVSSEDEVIFQGKRIASDEDKVVLAYNKPIGIECTSNLSVKKNIIEAVGYHKRVYPVGRLDKMSEGLILLTNDGELSNRILKARYFHEKEYVVHLDKPMSKAFLVNMSKGVHILDTVTRPCEVFKLTERTFKIVLTQGLNRQIRRMCEALGYEVVKLKRIRVLNVMLGDLEVGKWRLLTNDELSELRSLTEIEADDAFESQDFE